MTNEQDQLDAALFRLLISKGRCDNKNGNGFVRGKRDKASVAFRFWCSEEELRSTLLQELQDEDPHPPSRDCCVICDDYLLGNEMQASDGGIYHQSSLQQVTPEIHKALNQALMRSAKFIDDEIEYKAKTNLILYGPPDDLPIEYPDAFLYIIVRENKQTICYSSVSLNERREGITDKEWNSRQIYSLRIEDKIKIHGTSS